MNISIRKHKFFVLLSIFTILFFAVISFIVVTVLTILNVWSDIFALYIFAFSAILALLKIVNHRIYVTEEFIILPNYLFPLKKYYINLDSILSIEKGVRKIFSDNNALVVTIRTKDKEYIFRSNYFLHEDLQNLLSYLEPIVHNNLGYR